MLQDKPGVTHIWIPILLAAIFAFIVAHCFISVYEVLQSNQSYNSGRIIKISNGNWNLEIEARGGQCLTFLHPVVLHLLIKFNLVDETEGLHRCHIHLLLRGLRDERRTGKAVLYEPQFNGNLYNIKSFRRRSHQNETFLRC